MSQLDDLQVLMTKTRFRGLVTDVLEIFASFETNCSAGRNSDFFSGTGISSDASFASLDLEHPKATELNAFSTLHAHPHSVKNGVHGNF